MKEFNLTMKIKLSRIGIGDLVLLSSELLFQNNTEVCFSVSKDTLKAYKPKDIQGYSFFVQDLMKKLFRGHNISFSEDQTFPAMDTNWKIVQKAIRDKRISDHFKSVFSGETPAYDYYCIITKVRSFPKSDFLLMKSDFFKKINNKNIKLIVLGEREIEYGPEYQIYGSSMIYSIYSDIVSLVKKDLIVDMTVPRLGETTPDVDKLIKDMAIIKNSIKTFTFGHGGFFCTTLFTHKLATLIDKELIKVEFPSEINKQIFITKESFLNAI